MFKEPAFLSASKPEGPSMPGAEFTAHLRRMKEELKEDHRKGTPFFISELPPEDPARVFAGKENPD